MLYEPESLLAEKIMWQYVLDIATDTAHKVHSSSIHYCIKLAQKIEKEDLRTAHLLMLILKRSRPNGPFILNKLAEYEKALKMNL